MPFAEFEHDDQTHATLPFNLKDYIDLIDWAGRCIVKNTRGYISQRTPRILSEINLTEEQWQVLTLDIQKQSIDILHGLERLYAISKKRQNITT